MKERPHFAVPASADPGGPWTVRRRMQAAVLSAIAAGCLLPLSPAHAAPGSWRQKKEIPMLVSGLPAGCALDGFFYVIGGAESSNRTYAALQTVFAYDPQTDSW